MVKKKDGSIDWSKVKINPVINTTWGIATEVFFCEDDAITEIEKFAKDRLEIAQYWGKRGDIPGASKDYWEGVQDMSKDTLDFIDSLIKL